MSQTTQTNPILKTAIQAAAKWWADTIAGPPKFDNGDRSDAGFMSMGLASLLADKQPKPTEAQLASFQRELAEYIETSLQSGRMFDLFCDYGPGRDLAEIGLRNGISDALFPWKTCMWVYRGHVSVRHGYGAETQRIFPTWATAVSPKKQSLRLELSDAEKSGTESDHYVVRWEDQVSWVEYKAPVNEAGELIGVTADQIFAELQREWDALEFVQCPNQQCYRGEVYVAGKRQSCITCGGTGKVANCVSGD